MEICRKNKCAVIRCKNSEEYRENHIEGAVNIPVYEIDNIKMK